MAPDFTFPSFPPEERQVLVDTVTKHGKLPDEEFQHELQKIREEAKAEAQKNGVEYQPYDPKFRQLLEQARQVMARRREEKELARQAEEAARATNEPEPMDVDMDDSPITSPREPREDTAVESIPRDERKVKRSAGRPRRKDSTTPTTAEYTPSPQADLSSHAVHLRQSQPPTWYLRLKKPGKDKQKREQKLMKDPRKRQIITALSALKDCLARCETERNPLALEKHFNDLRNYIHQAEFLAVDDAMLVKLHLLDADNGLTKIFAPQSNVDFPWDLKEDARQLYRRWADGKFEISLLRGILTSKTKDDNRSADRLDPRWDTVSPKYYGEGSLVLGQWWPTQLCTVRDGAHGSSQGGIYGEKSKGAYSIIVAGGYPDDIDHGAEIYYCGTESKSDVPTDATTRMLESFDSGNPIRVIRSFNLAVTNPYRPERGYRYDGLYTVVGKQLVRPENAVWRFLLRRLQGQNPIRCEKGSSWARPTVREIEAYDREVGEREFRMAMERR